MEPETPEKRRCTICGGFLNSYNKGDQCLHHNKLKGDFLPHKFASAAPIGRVGIGIRSTIRQEYGSYMN